MDAVEIQSDLDATDRDIDQLVAICTNLENFMSDCSGGNRRYLHADLMRYRRMLNHARDLRGRIALRLAECKMRDSNG